MKTCIFLGSPRKANTHALTAYFADELEKNGVEVSISELLDMQIAPCRGCYACQNVTGEYGCVQHDDMYSIVEDMISSDIIVLATPIFTWYCTAQMKSMLDRLYGMNKYYGTGEGSLWAGKTLSLLLTHGYEGEYATGPFELGMKRLCEHSGLLYGGMYSVRDEDNLASFTTAKAENGARVFAQRLIALEKRKAAAKNTDAAPTKAGFAIRIAVDKTDCKSASEIYSNSWRAGYRGILKDETIALVTDDGWSAKFENNLTASKYLLFIMSVNGEDIGACTLGVAEEEEEDGRAAEMVSFYYKEEYWGKRYNGITYAEHLMRYALAVIRLQGYKSAYLWTLKGNFRAIGFYEKCGFSLTGEDKDFTVKGEATSAVQLKIVL